MPCACGTGYFADEVDPKNELAVYCDDEGGVDPLQVFLPAANGMAENARSNTFHLFKEDWEDLSVDNKNHTMRYRLADKKKGMWMRDLSDEYDDYRSVVDLQWSQQKVKDYGKK